VVNMRIQICVSPEAIEQITSERLRMLKTHDSRNKWKEAEIYDKDFLEYLEENDEISVREGGFMCGYLEG